MDPNIAAGSPASRCGGGALLGIGGSALRKARRGRDRPGDPLGRNRADRDVERQLRQSAPGRTLLAWLGAPGPGRGLPCRRRSAPTPTSPRAPSPTLGYEVRPPRRRPVERGGHPVQAAARRTCARELPDQPPFEGSRRAAGDRRHHGRAAGLEPVRPQRPRGVEPALRLQAGLAATRCAATAAAELGDHPGGLVAARRLQRGARPTPTSGTRAAFEGCTHVTEAERDRARRAARRRACAEIEPRPLKYEVAFTFWDYRQLALPEEPGHAHRPGLRGAAAGRRGSPTPTWTARRARARAAATTPRSSIDLRRRPHDPVRPRHHAAGAPRLHRESAVGVVPADAGLGRGQVRAGAASRSAGSWTARTRRWVPAWSCTGPSPGCRSGPWRTCRRARTSTGSGSGTRTWRCATWLEPMLAHLKARGSFSVKMGPNVVLRRWSAPTLKEAIAVGRPPRGCVDLPADEEDRRRAAVPGSGCAALAGTQQDAPGRRLRRRPAPVRVPGPARRAGPRRTCSRASTSCGGATSRRPTSPAWSSSSGRSRTCRRSTRCTSRRRSATGSGPGRWTTSCR